MVRNREERYHIVIVENDYDKAYELFEEIQNKYNLYDNCIIETSEKYGIEIADRIVIETTDYTVAKRLLDRLKKEYNLINIKLVEVNKEETIIDNERNQETGGLPV